MAKSIVRKTLRDSSYKHYSSKEKNTKNKNNESEFLKILKEKMGK